LFDVNERWVRASGGHEVEATVEPLQTRCQFAVQVVDMEAMARADDLEASPQDFDRPNSYEGPDRG
jgi:hypothetical protein